jgi:alpha-2-macroglobulin
MKSIAKNLIAVLSIILTVAAIPSCSRFGKSKGQSTEFATFIKAYTGGIISDKSTIRVELASDIPDATPGDDLKDGILTFSPSVKGTARWLSKSMIEFIPNAEALQSGQSYTGKLRLDKIQKVGSRKFRKFSFKFLVAIKEAVLSMNEITITGASPEKASIEGIISLTEELPLEKVQKMIEYDYFDHSAEVNVTAGTDPKSFHFEIINLPRDTKDRVLKVKLRPEDTGFVTDSKLEITVPAMNNFKVLSAERIDADPPYIDIYFTEALADLDDNSGLFVVEGAGRSYVQSENAHVKVFYENTSDDPVTLRISASVKSHAGDKLAQDYFQKFSATELKPAVEIPVTGSILPNSKELILPFKAVNLSTVDIKVIQIYESNVLAFLQGNTLSGENSLRRCGRLIYKRCVRLDSDPSKNLHKWQDYSVDLSGLFKQEPGAIYRIRISFKQEYSLYGKSESFKSGTPSDEMVNISSEAITEEDDEEWDMPYPDYYDSYYDWEKYNWKERENPLKPSYYMEDERFPAINLLTSNLGVIAKYSGGDRIWISVSDILSTDPVFNAELYVYSYQLKEIGYAKTGTDGMAEITVPGKPFVIVAKRGGATSYLKVTPNEQNSLSRFDVGGKKLEKGLKAFIYGERGVWRPGDTLHVTMILEDKENKIPDNHPSIMEIYTPEGQFYTKQINSNGKNGFYSFAIPTKSEDPTGTYHAYFKIGGASFHKALKIESIKPNRLKINLDFGCNVIESGRTIPVNLSSNWLTGPAAAGLAAKVNMVLHQGASTFAGFEGYKFTSPLTDYTTSEHQLVSTRLNMDGQATVKVTMPAADGAPGMLKADIVTTVEEQGGDVSFSTMTLPYSPYSSYVGVRIPAEGGNRYLETDKDYKVDVVVVDKNGEKVSGHNLKYTVYKMKWSWWWESRSESLDSYVNSPSAEVIASGTFKSRRDGNSFPLRVDYPDWGRYLVLVTDTDSGHISGDIVYIDWPAYRGRSSKTDPDALTMLSFSTDKDSYEVGETVTLYIPAASKGQALVSLENSRKVLSRTWVKTNGDGDATYSFKVTQDMAPNFYIHVTLVQPHERNDNDLPIRLYGIRPVLVSNKESHLEPVIKMPDVLRPEEEFTIKVKEKNGKPMSYTLAIVDEGLLDLTAFKTPDPWSAMYAREALGVSTWDLYDDVIGAYSGRFSPMFSIGGDESIMTSAKKDNRFNAVVKYLGPFTLQNGSATHKIKLPMYVGSVRVMLVAGKDGAYGNAEKTVPVRSPLMVLPTLPRVIGTGEKVAMPVNVFALEDAVKNAEVSVRVEGPLKLIDDSKCTLSFSAPGDKLAGFNLEATGNGTATVYVTANGNGHKASEKISIEVRTPNPPVVSVSRALIAKGGTKHFGFTPFTPDADQWATLEFTGFPSINCGEIFTYLSNYSFNCSEQISSKGISLLAIKKMLPAEKQKEIDTMIPELLRQLYQRQLGSGGFVYWPGNTEANGWISSMAGQFMISAAQNGYNVNKGVLAIWSRYQKKNVQDYRNSDNGGSGDLEQAYRLYTLALNGEAESGAMNRLKESETLSRQAAWMLAATYAITGKKTVAKEMIAQLKTDFEDSHETNRTFGSPTRDKAIALEALVLADALPEAMDVAQEVADAFYGGWYSTQEAAFTTCAMRDLALRIGTGTISADVTQGENTVKVKSANSIASAEVDTENGSINIVNTMDGSLYATLVTSIMPAAGDKVEAKSSGLNLNASYSTLSGSPINPHDIPQGTDFTVSIKVTNTSGTKDYTDLALTEMIPSGWEIVNDRLFGGEASNATFNYRDIRDDRVCWFFNLPKGSSKTFRIKMHASYQGEFILPSIKCEAMYDPHVNANTASGTAKVSE